MGGTRWVGTIITAMAAAALGAPVAHAAGTLEVGAATVDGTYHVGSSAGQYASARTDEFGAIDPHLQATLKQASYGIQSRLKVRAIVVRNGATTAAFISDNHYIPQDALRRRTAQLLDEATRGAINARNLVMTVTHNHSSPSYSSLDWGVWTFQDVFDFRFFDYYARQNAQAVLDALAHMHRARMSATATGFDALQRNPMGPGVADDGTPDGFPQSFTDHDLSVVRFDDVDDAAHPQPLAVLVNLGQHPEMLEGYDLVSGEFPETMARFVDRSTGAVTLFTQNATGTSEVERDSWHDVHARDLFDHAQYAQMEWGARLLADGVLGAYRAIGDQRPDADTTSHFGMTSYRDRFVPWTTDPPLGVEDRWFDGPVSHPLPGVSSCRTDPALAGAPRLPLVGLPDCAEVDLLGPVRDQVPPGFPGITTDTLEALGVPVPENLSFPSTGALEDTASVHLQALRLGDVLLTICSCEQWVDQSYNIKTRTDTVPGNEWLGYDWSQACTQQPDRTWTCPPSKDQRIPDARIQHMRAQVRNDAAGWDDPACAELGCGLQAESEPTDLAKIRGNYTHDDTAAHSAHGYRMTIPVAMANDYNGYIATYREFSDHDHYRKALTGWGPHSSDYLATRLVRMGRALHGDPDAPLEPGVKAIADQALQDTKVRVVGELAAQGTRLYPRTLPNDGGAADAMAQPADIERFDATTFTWTGGNNITDDPVVVVERRDGDRWVRFADQSGELPVTLDYPGRGLPDLATYRLGGQVWHWTATFEAFVSRFPLVAPDGTTYRATPVGTYRFVVHGTWRKGGRDAPYTRISRAFVVRPWDGITVERARVTRAGRLRFTAGPTHTFRERRVRNTETKDRGTLEVRIGPVDYPDTAHDQRATGARFLDHTRGYAAAPDGTLEHYCLDCRFRDWLDATDRLRARVTVRRRSGSVVRERVRSDRRGRFAPGVRLRPGDRATIVVRDEWGDVSGTPARVRQAVP